MTELGPLENPQVRKHFGSISDGFILPIYETSQNAGCPPNSF